MCLRSARAAPVLLLALVLGCQQGGGGFALRTPWSDREARKSPEFRQLQEQLARAEQEANRTREELALARELLADQAQRDLAVRLIERDQATPRTAPASASTKPDAPSRKGVTPEALAKVAEALRTPGLPVERDGPVVRIRIPADRLFAPGSDRLLPAATELLDPLAAQIQELFPRQKLSIEGYTDNNPAFRGAFRSGHELTAAQTSTVYHQLVQRNGLAPEQLLLIAQGPNYPRGDNGTAAGRVENRRIELVIFPDTF